MDRSVVLFILEEISYLLASACNHLSNINIVALRAFNVTFVSVYLHHPNSTLIEELSSLLLMFITHYGAQLLVIPTPQNSLVYWMI